MEIEQKDLSIESLNKQIKEKDELNEHLKQQISAQMTTKPAEQEDEEKQIKTISSEYVENLDVKISSKLMKGKDKEMMK